MATIDYSSGSRVVNERPHTVYTKAVWTDDWTAQPNMSCYECLWTAAPNINTARLRWEIGSVILPGDTEPTTIGVWVGRGQFVMVDWLCDDGSTILRWVGYIDSTSRPSEAFGFQEIVAYGLERSLALTTISRSVWWDDIHDEIRVSQVAFPFNGPTGLRSDVTQEFGDEDVYLFADQNKATPESTAYAAPWSTREIVRYLLTQMLPTSDLGVSVIPWSIVGIDVLPDWDAPRVDTEYRTVWDVLNELVNAKHLLGFTCGNDGSDAVTIKFFTHVASDLTISGNTIPANPTQHTLITQPDALTNAYYADVTGGYDQVICRGARKQVIHTVGYWDDDVVYGGLYNYWKNSERTAYNNGASLESGYSALTDSEKRQANARVRRSAKVANVFKRFVIFNGTYAIDTLGWQPLRILSRLPIKPGTDWSGPVNTDHYDRDGEGIEPVLSFRMPGTDDLDARILATALDSLQTKPKKAFSLKLSTKGRFVFIDVIGAEQHIIAAQTAGGFVPLPVDDPSYAFIDQLSIHLTAAFEIDSHVEGSYPETAPTANIVRRLIVDAGPEYKHIEIINEEELKTVAGVDSFAYETFSDGGILVDDTEKLVAIARFIAQSYALTRQAVSWQSQRKIGGISVGDLITTGDGATINSPVMAININGGVSINRPAAATVQSFETYRGGSDPHALIVSMQASKKKYAGPGNTPQRIVDTGAKRVSTT